MWPSLSERDIPHQTKVQQEILLCAHGAEVKVSDTLANIKGRVLFTFNTWTSDAQDPYLSVTGHYITAPKDSVLRSGPVRFFDPPMGRP